MSDNRTELLTRLDELAQVRAGVNLGGSERSLARHRARGKLTARERIELLLDRDSPFLELSPYAAWGTDFPVGAGVVTGIGVVEGVEVLVNANDPTVRGGTSNPFTLRKLARAHQIAEQNRLPYVSLVESGGADLPTQAEIFIPGGRMFRDLTRLSAQGIATVAVVFGNSTAGGAYVPGLSDHVIMIDGRSQVFLAGPPLVKMATGEDADEEALGGASMHARTSGSADHLAVDETDALRLARQVVRHLGHRKLGPGPTLPPDPPLRDPQGLLDLAPADLRRPLDPREVLAHVVDGSRFDEHKPLYGTSLVTGWASIHGYPVGVLANARGVLFREDAEKAAQFIQLANSADTPLLFLQNTTGYMVGVQYEQAGIIKAGSQMINAVSNSRVPHLTLNIGASYGAGNYGMCGRAYDPRFLFTWPNAKSAVMGPAQLAGVLDLVGRRQRAGAGARLRRRSRSRDEGGGRAADRGGVARAVPVRPALRRRHHRSARHPDRPGARAVGGARSARPRRPRRLGGVPPVTALQCVLVANRGEIARRVFATARAMGMRTVAVYSDADADAPFVAEADLAVRLPGSAAHETYLRGDLIVAAALAAGADCIHPGYGFLSENAEFARAVAASGLVFIGPSPAAIEAMGSKIAAKALMSAAGVPTLPSVEATGLDDDALLAAAADIGYPVLVKASFGGGGRGMRGVTAPADLVPAVRSAEREAASAFGDGTVFLEKLLERARHVEVQVFGDTHGHTVALFERECSIQRRHQKVIEEAPSPAVDDALRTRLHEAAVRAATALAYVGAGTVEFLLTEDGDFFFLEVNTRLQVEHPVTEAVTGLDLVRLQIEVAAGRALPVEALTPTRSGHAVQVRLYAEDPAHDYLPQAGRLDAVELPASVAFGRWSGPGVRLDSAVESGSLVGVHYDPMLAKVIAWAPDRAQACALLTDALRRARLHGLITNRDLLVGVLTHPEFLAGATDTGFLERHGVAALAAHDRTGAALHAVAAALAGAHLRRTTAHALALLPSGWRNNPTQPQTTRFDTAEVAYTLHGGTLTATVDDEPIEMELDGVQQHDDAHLDVLLGWRGLRVPVAVHCVDDRVHVDSPFGWDSFRELPRFVAPSARIDPGSLVAALPGTVTTVPVRVGDRVEAGQVLLVLEAMKMEHPVVAPAAGVLESLNVTVGVQVETGAMLAVVAPADQEPT